MGIALDKAEILEWARKHDLQNTWWISQEKEIGDRLRQTKELTKGDLLKIIEWKFESDARVKTVEIKRVLEIHEPHLSKVSREVFASDVSEDAKRIMLLCSFNGIGPAVASVILTFFDPINYCVVDFHVYQELFGFRPKALTIDHYTRLLDKLRVIAIEYDLPVRTLEKAYFYKNCVSSKCR